MTHPVSHQTEALDVLNAQLLMSSGAKKRAE